MTRNEYFEALSARRLEHQTKRQTATGLVIGWAAVLISGYRLFFTVGANDTLWRAAFVAGCVALAVTIVIPAIWTLPERFLHAVNTRIFGALFSAMLSLTYLVFFIPLGIYMRHKKSRYQLTTWDSAENLPSSWEDKPLGTKPQVTVNKRRWMVLSPFELVGYFVRQGHIILLPALFFMLFLGVVLFFIKTSVIAPFIYTLF